MTQTVITNHDNKRWKVDLPDKCPLCHHLIVVGNFSIDGVFDGRAELVYRCPNPDCLRFFLGYYDLQTIGNGQTGLAKLRRFIPVELSKDELPQILNEISPNFVAIYKEAMEAKDIGLSQICGSGFRKAFEFLIKDYAKRTTTDEEKKQRIENVFAGVVVNEYINDARIQAVAKRALWLGNDETHYLRKWEQHDIDDLITLIKLTIHWIEIERLSNEYIEEMPEKSNSDKNGG